MEISKGKALAVRLYSTICGYYVALGVQVLDFSSGELDASVVKRRLLSSNST